MTLTARSLLVLACLALALPASAAAADFYSGGYGGPGSPLDQLLQKIKEHKQKKKTPAPTPGPKPMPGPVVPGPTVQGVDLRLEPVQVFLPKLGELKLGVRVRNVGNQAYLGGARLVCRLESPGWKDMSTSIPALEPGEDWAPYDQTFSTIHDPTKNPFTFRVWVEGNDVNPNNNLRKVTTSPLDFKRVFDSKGAKKGPLLKPYRGARRLG